MKNAFFEVNIDPNTGLIESIIHPNDPHRMNFVSTVRKFGRINNKNKRSAEPFLLCDIMSNDQFSTATYETDRLGVRVSRSFSKSGNLTMRYTIYNKTQTVVCINRDQLGIEFPFNDVYTTADDCMANRCHTHIWCGYHSSWINALRMGDSEINLGVILTEGSLESYSQYACKTNERGFFEVEPETFFLNGNEEYALEWEFFWHKGHDDFEEQLKRYPSYLHIDAQHYTVLKDEKISFSFSTSGSAVPCVFLEDSKIPVEKAKGRYLVDYVPVRNGEHRLIIKWGKRRTVAEFMVKPSFAELISRRVHFIARYQQCLDPHSPLYGAYLIYDNKLKTTYFDYFVPDHNAFRERLNMAFVMIRFLRQCPDAKVRTSVDLFLRFLFRECYEVSNGDVYNNIGKRNDMLRLYNAPGVMLLFAEMYLLTQDEQYLNHIMRLADKYYAIGGERCYSNAVAIRKVMSAFGSAGRTEDAEKLFQYYQRHVDQMIQNGLSYPEHEVNYEQTIVTPAVLCISEMGMLCENKAEYIQQARKHLQCLERFVGHQPSYHMNEISIRFWDDFWFGKAGSFGDTFPHHLSCLTARAFAAFARLTGEEKWITRAGECIRNCLCLIGDDGTGSAAYVYPHTVNGRAGEFWDEWANDQDLPLYDAMELGEWLPEFRLAPNIGRC